MTIEQPVARTFPGRYPILGCIVPSAPRHPVVCRRCQGMQSWAQRRVAPHMLPEEENGQGHRVAPNRQPRPVRLGQNAQKSKCTHGQAGYEASYCSRPAIEGQQQGQMLAPAPTLRHERKGNPLRRSGSRCAACADFFPDFSEGARLSPMT